MKTWYKNKRVFNKDNTVQIFKTAPSLFKATKCSKAKNTDLNETIQMNSNFERETDRQSERVPYHWSKCKSWLRVRPLNAD